MQAMHASSAWEPSRDEACDPGWMLPLVVFARTYSTFLSTFGDDYMYRLQKPLPLAELHQPGRNRGLVSLLKFAMWQVDFLRPIYEPPHFLPHFLSLFLPHPDFWGINAVLCKFHSQMYNG